jgi:hypothetical protein
MSANDVRWLTEWEDLDRDVPKDQGASFAEVRQVDMQRFDLDQRKVAATPSKTPPKRFVKARNRHAAISMSSLLDPFLEIGDILVSHATAWSSREIQTAALQQQARDWWSIERPKFDLVASQLTLGVVSRGDSAAC